MQSRFTACLKLREDVESIDTGQHRLPSGLKIMESLMDYPISKGV